MRSSFLGAVTIAVASTRAALFAQWLNYPTPGALTLRTASLTSPLRLHAAPTENPISPGMWGWVNIGPPCGAKCGDTQISREFMNLAATLRDRALPALGGGVSQETQGRAGSRPERSLHAACSSSDLDRRLLQADFRGSGPRTDRAQYQIPTDLHRWTSVSGRPESDLERVIRRPLGRRDSGLSRRLVSGATFGGCERGSANGARQEPRDYTSHVRESGSGDDDQPSESFYRALASEAEPASGSRQRTHRLLPP